MESWEDELKKRYKLKLDENSSRQKKKLREIEEDYTRQELLNSNKSEKIKVIN